MKIATNHNVTLVSAADLNAIEDCFAGTYGNADFSFLADNEDWTVDPDQPWTDMAATKNMKMRDIITRAPLQLLWILSWRGKPINKDKPNGPRMKSQWLMDVQAAYLDPKEGYLMTNESACAAWYYALGCAASKIRMRSGRYSGATLLEILMHKPDYYIMTLSRQYDGFYDAVINSLLRIAEFERFYESADEPAIGSDEVIAANDTRKSSAYTA